MESRRKVTKCSTHGWHESIVAGRCELIQAISQGDLEGVRQYLTPENMVSTGRKGWTPLVFACRSGQVEILKFLINAGADVRAIDKSGSSLLHHANSAEVAEILLDSGIDVNHAAKYGLRPLHVSSRNDSDVVVRLLLESGADVFAIDTLGRTALQYFKHCSTLVLLEYFGDADVRCKRVGCRCQSTVLMCSSRKATRPVIGMSIYEKYFIKTRTAGLPLADSIPLMDPRLSGPSYHSWCSFTRRVAFRLECILELERMAVQKLPDTAVYHGITYLSVFHQNPSALRNPVIQQTLTPDHCNQLFPIYGETLRRRFVAGLRKLFLQDRAADAFEVHVPPLLPECVTGVLSYLEIEDLKNLLIVCTGRQNLERLCQMPVSRIIEFYGETEPGGVSTA